MKNKNPSKISGWLLILLIGFGLSALNFILLLAQKTLMILSGRAQWGVYLSAVLLLIYLVLIISSIFLILKKKRKSIQFSIAALIIGFIFIVWYTILGPILYYNSKGLSFGIVVTLVNLLLSIIVVSYLKRSRRVRITLIR